MHTSDKLASINPPWTCYHFPWLLPLALANGVFECDARKVWSRAYAHHGHISIEEVRVILTAFEKVKLLFRWKDVEGKEWGYWVGIDKPGRLPGRSRRGINEKVGPEPPKDLLNLFFNDNGIHTETNGIQKHLGFGSGFGSGSGFGADSIGAESSSRSPKTLALISAPGPGFEVFWQAYPKRCGKQDARKAWKKIIGADQHLPEILSGVEKWKLSDQWNQNIIPNPATFLNGRRWEDEVPQNGRHEIQQRSRRSIAAVAAVPGKQYKQPHVIRND